ncbi:MAG: zinc-ribbon domain-containing protein [Sandaracinaceae bacterium]|nr:zinc-ribbon domain-containing protein [Sandaracinaceae bacterium]
MKIVCDSCGAKYSIADEKVAGRVFKIRCKKCGEAIVVRGDQAAAEGGGAPAPAGEESTRVVDYGGDAVWHVVLDGEQQGPYAPGQLGEMLSAGTMGWDAFVWREGFDDWKAAQDVEELVQAIMGGGQAAAESGHGADPFAATQAAPMASGGGGGGLFGGEAAVARGDAGADLFAQTDTASPFGAAPGDDEEDVVASAPSPRVSAEQALTGARNENSVLFSLSNLQALATGPAASSSSPAAKSSPAAPSAQPKAGMASGEGSGLIDIRALAGATGIGGGPSAPITPAKVDDLLSIGGPPVAGLGSALAAPIIVPEKKEESSKTGLFIGLGVGGVAVIAAAAVVAVVVLKQPEPAAPPVGAVGTVGPGLTTPTPAPTPPTPTTPTAPVAAPDPTTAPAAGTPPPAPAPSQAAAPEPPSGEGRRAGGRRPSGGNQPSSGNSASAPTPPPSSARTASGNIDDLLENALTPGSGGRRPAAERPAPSGGGSGPPTPGRSDIVSAMASVQGAVSACGNGAHGVATVRIAFAGSTGRVSNAQANGSFPPPVLSCIARAVRGARVPQFQQATFTVNYPFRI